MLWNALKEFAGKFGIGGGEKEAQNENAGTGNKDEKRTESKTQPLAVPLLPGLSPMPDLLGQWKQAQQAQTVSLPQFPQQQAAAAQQSAAKSPTPVTSNSNFNFEINGMPSQTFAQGIMDTIKAHQSELSEMMQSTLERLVSDQVRRSYAAGDS